MNQFIKFIGVGGINTLITYILYILLLQLFTYQISYTVTYMFGIGLSYWLNLKYVFQEKNSRKKLLLFPFIYLLQYTLGILILYITIDKYDIAKELGPILVVLITTPLVFILTKKILITKKYSYDIE